MTSIVLCTNQKRPDLLRQSLRTLYENTPMGEYTLTIVNEGPRWREEINRENTTVLTIEPACHVLGRLKNLGAHWSEKHFGKGEFICFLDDDVAMFPEWLPRMIHVTKICALVGGSRHPYHSDTMLMNGYELSGAVAGYCHFMRWWLWDAYGPYDANAAGVGQSEDWALCKRLTDAGYSTGYIVPPVMAHTGITNSEGKPAVGSELIERVPGVLYR